MRLFLTTVLILVMVVGSIAAVFVYKEQKRTEEAHNAVELASSFLAQGKVEEAIKTLSPIYEDFSRFEAMDRVIYLLATAYEETSSEHAPLLWRQLAKEFPDSPHHEEALLAWSDSLATSEPQKAREIVEPLSSSADPEIAASALAIRADSFFAEGEVQQAREIYREVARRYPGTEAEETALNRLSEINMEMFKTASTGEFTEIYTVKRGDSVHKIAVENRTTRDLIMELNGIGTNLRPGQRIIIPKTEFKIVVDKSRLRLFLLTQDGRFVKWYKVAIGEEDYKTPAGDYKVELKQVDPTWYKPGGGVIPPGDPENALGPRWIGIGSHLGIHGNNDPDSVGQRASAGCIRMYNDDVIELYKILTLGNEVKIVDRFSLGSETAVAAPSEPPSEE